MKNNLTNPNLSLVIPVYNEAEEIEKVFSDWEKEFAILHIDYTIIAINDGSKDNSLSILNQLAQKNSRIIILNQTNQGHGPAILNGYKKALELGSMWIAQCDSDNQILANEFATLWLNRNDFDFISGRRKQRHDPAIRKIMSACMKLGVFILFRNFVPDPNCPFRIYKSTFLQKALSRIPVNSFAPNIHLAVEAFKNSKKTIVLNVKHQERQSGTPSLQGIFRLLGIGNRVIKELLKQRFQITPKTSELSLGNSSR